MALSYPLSVGAFIKALPVSKITFHPTSNVTMGTTGAGELLTVGNGERLWEGRVMCDMDRWAAAEADMALIREMEEVGGTFLMTPLHMEKTGAAGATLNTVNGRQVRFSAAGAGRVLTVGTYFSFAYGGGRYSLHQLSETVTADGTGLTPLGQVVPPVPASVPTPQAVQFAQPVCKAIIKPGSVRAPDIRTVIAEPFSFEWRQTRL